MLFRSRRRADIYDRGSVGSAIFLALVQVFLAFAIHSYRQRGDRTLQLLILTWLPLSVRGACESYSLTWSPELLGKISLKTNSDGIVSVLVDDYSCAPQRVFPCTTIHAWS